MNYFYGVKIKKAYSSEENWYKINKYGGIQLIYCSLFYILIGFLFIFFPKLFNYIPLKIWIINLITIFLGLAFSLARIYIYASKI